VFIPVFEKSVGRNFICFPFQTCFDLRSVRFRLLSSEYVAECSMTSYPKATHGQSKRSTRPRKRKSPWSKDEEKEVKEEEISNTSASSKKLSSANVFDAEVNRAHAYKIIDFLSVFQTLAQLLICRKCLKNVEFRESGIRGFGFKIVVLCSCDSTQINFGPQNEFYEEAEGLLYAAGIAD